MRIDPSLPDASLTLVSELPPCDTSRRFVRVIEQRRDGLVAFEFAIGWPDLAVELLLPERAFADFCAVHRVQRLDHWADGAKHPCNRAAQSAHSEANRRL